MSVSRVLRKRSHCPSYKEKGEWDIPAHYRRKVQDKLYPIEVIEEDPVSTLCKVHYIGYSSVYDEWKEKDAIVDTNTEDPDEDLSQSKRFSLHQELATRIKTALSSSRKSSPTVRIDLPFDRIEFNGGLGIHGVKKSCIRGIQHYTISKFQDLNVLLGDDWHYRGVNINGDFCYVILNTVDFYLYHRRRLKEFVPSAGSVKEVCRDRGDVLVFCFVKGDGTPAQFGKDKNIFVS